MTTKREEAERIHDRMAELEEKEEEGTLAKDDELEYAELERDMENLQPLWKVSAPSNYCVHAQCGKLNSLSAPARRVTAVASTQAGALFETKRNIFLRVGIMSSEISDYREAKKDHDNLMQILTEAERQACPDFYYDQFVAVKFRLVVKEEDYERPQYTSRLARFIGIACTGMKELIFQKALELSHAELEAQKQKAQDEAIAFIKES